MLENFRLQVFRAVATRQSFRRAAEGLYVTQPAVTQNIKALEAELGQRLFDREGGRVRLTAAGETLLRYAERSREALAQAEEQLAQLQGRVGGTLSVAASTTIAQYVLPRLLGAFARQYPGVAVQLESSNTETVVERVAEGKTALGLIEGPAHRPDLLLEPWITDELVLVVPAAHRWAGGTIAPELLGEAPLLMREQGSGTRAVLESALHRAGLFPEAMRVGMELGSTEALLACVESGLGVGFASRFALRRQRRLGTLAVVRVTGLTVKRELQILRRRGPLQASLAADAFHSHLLAYAQRREYRRAARRRSD